MVVLPDVAIGMIAMRTAKPAQICSTTYKQSTSIHKPRHSHAAGQIVKCTDANHALVNGLNDMCCHMAARSYSNAYLISVACVLDHR